jgi:hypothetical protein
MKHITSYVVAFVVLSVVGCSLSYQRKTFDEGFYFFSENVNKIILGKTTGDEIIDLFGGPLAKIEIMQNEEQWRYYYSTGIEIRESGFLTDEVQSTRWHKTLVIRFKNGIVTGFIYTEGQ